MSTQMFFLSLTVLRQISGAVVTNVVIHQPAGDFICSPNACVHFHWKLCEIRLDESKLAVGVNNCLSLFLSALSKSSVPRGFALPKQPKWTKSQFKSFEYSWALQYSTIESGSSSVCSFGLLYLAKETGWVSNSTPSLEYLLTEGPQCLM